MVFAQQDLITVGGIPAHPLLVHAVVVLLPLATLGGLVIASRATWRRRFWLPVLAVTAAAVGAVPLAAETGEQLQAALPPNPAIQKHAELGGGLLPFALAFGVAVLLLVIAGRLADRERDAAGTAAVAANGGRVRAATSSAEPGADGASAGQAGADRAAADRAGDTVTGDADTRGAGADGAVTVTRTWRRIAIVAAALVAFTGVAATVQVVRIGDSGSRAVWEGVGGG